MTAMITEGPAIVAGYEYKLQIEAEAAIFPVGCVLVGHVRRTIADASIVATLTTANGGLARISDTVLEITIGGSATANLPVGSVVMDLVRTDLDPDQHLNFLLEIPVVKSVTRGLT